MIGFIRGRIVDQFVLNDNFRQIILWPYKDSKIPGIGITVTISKYVHLKSDLVELWTYTIHNDRELSMLATDAAIKLKFFLKLLNIQGIGPKTAILIVDFFNNVEELVKIIIDKDTKTLSKVPGLGKKTAAKMVVSLLDDIEDLGFLDDHTHKDRNKVDNKEFGLLHDTLRNLGFSSKESTEMIERVYTELSELVKHGASIEDQLKLVLQNR